MYLPIRRWRAVVVGVVLVMTCHRAGGDEHASAGVVPPPASEPRPARAGSPDAASAGLEVDLRSALPLAANGDQQPFWFPGVDIALDPAPSSAIPIQSSEAGPGLPGVQQHPLIPLPGAAWTGMAGLLGLGAVKLLRNFRRLLN